MARRRLAGGVTTTVAAVGSHAAPFSSAAGTTVQCSSDRAEPPAPQGQRRRGRGGDPPQVGRHALAGRAEQRQPAVAAQRAGGAAGVGQHHGRVPLARARRAGLQLRGEIGGRALRAWWSGRRPSVRGEAEAADRQHPTPARAARRVRRGRKDVVRVMAGLLCGLALAVVHVRR